MRSCLYQAHLLSQSHSQFNFAYGIHQRVHEHDATNIYLTQNTWLRVGKLCQALVTEGGKGRIVPGLSIITK
jgi:hypothetical protein